MGRVDDRDLAQRRRGRVAARDPGRRDVRGELRAPGAGEGGAQVELPVRRVQPRHRPVGDARAGGVDLLRLPALGDGRGGLLLLPGALLGDLGAGAFLEVGDGAQDVDATALGDRRETGVGVAVVAHLVGEHGPQPALGQPRHQRQPDAEPPGAAREPEETGVLGDRRVDVAGEQDLVRGAGPDLLGDVPHGLPEPWLPALVHPYAGHVLVRGRPEHEHAPDDREGEHRADDEHLQREGAGRVDGRRPVGGGQGGEQEEAEQVEAREQDESARGARCWAHRAVPPTGKEDVPPVGAHGAPGRYAK